MARWAIAGATGGATMPLARESSLENVSGEAKLNCAVCWGQANMRELISVKLGCGYLIYKKIQTSRR